MFVVFGRVKESRQVSPVLQCHCYRCQRQRGWDLWRETEWVSFFALKTVPFPSRVFLVCSACGDTAPLDKPRYRQLTRLADTRPLHEYLEQHQFADKNETQRAFLRSQREQSERQQQACRAGKQDAASVAT